MDPHFFPSIYGPRASCLGHKLMEKNLVHNLQYGPKTWLIRGMNATESHKVMTSSDSLVNLYVLLQNKLCNASFSFFPLHFHFLWVWLIS